MYKRKFKNTLISMSAITLCFPSPLVFALEKENFSPEELIEFARNSKDLYHYNKAYASIMAEPNNPKYYERLSLLAPLRDEILGFSSMMDIIAEIQDVVQKNESIEQYNSVVLKVRALYNEDKISMVDKEYLDAELDYWTRSPIFQKQSHLPLIIDWAMEASSFLEEGKVREARKLINKAHDLLYGENNLNYLNREYLKKDTLFLIESKINEVEKITPLEVIEIKALNSREIKVSFDDSVDKESALDLTNYIFTIDGNTYSSENGNIEDLIDYNNITFNNDDNYIIFPLYKDKNSNSMLRNGSKYIVDVKNGIYSLDKSKRVNMYKGEEQQFIDTEKPKVLSSKLTTSYNANRDKELKISFNKPIKSIDAIKVDGITLYDSSNKNIDTKLKYIEKAGDYSVIVQYGSTDNDAFKEGKLIYDLIKKGIHNVTLYKVSDEVYPLANTSNILNVEYEIKNDEIPFVKELKPSNDNERAFNIIFSDNIDINTIKNNLKIEKNYLKLDGENGTPKFTITSVRDLDEDINGYNKDYSKEFTVEFLSDYNLPYKLFDDYENTIKLSVKLGNYYNIEGVLGRYYEGEVTLSKNTATPRINFKNCGLCDEGIIIEFNKDIKDLDPSKIMVTDKDGIHRAIDYKNTKIIDDSYDNKGYEKNRSLFIKLEGFEGKSIFKEYQDKAPYKITFKRGAVKASSFIEHILNNEETIIIDKYKYISPVVLGVSDIYTDYEKPSIINGSVVNKITIDYKYEMDKSACDLFNYSLEGNSFPEGTTISMDNYDKKVIITLPEGFIKNTGSYLLEINDKVKTKDGSSVVGALSDNRNYTKVITLTDNKKPSIVSAKYLVNNLNDKTSNKIKVEFDENLKDLTNNINSMNNKDNNYLENLQNSLKDDLNVQINGSNLTINSIDDEIIGDNFLEITLNENISVNQNGIVSIVPIGNKNEEIHIKDRAGNIAAITSGKLEGKVLKN